MISNFTCLKAIDMKIHRPLQCNFVIIWRSESENYWTRASDHCILEVLVQAMEHFKKAREREREMFYLTTHSTHFIYGYMVSDIWLRTILIVRKETRCSHIGYSYRLTARVLLYAPSHRQDNTYHGLCYTSHGALVEQEIDQCVHTMKDRSDDPQHHE